MGDPIASAPRRRGTTDAEPFLLGPVLVDPTRNMVSVGPRTMPLEPKTMGVINALAKSGSASMTRDALLTEVWGSDGGSDEALSRAVSLCRRAFAGLEADDPIKTVPRHGYALSLPPTLKSAPRRARTLPRVRTLYREGRTLTARISHPAELATAVAKLEEATRLDPAFAQGWSALAQARATAAAHTPFCDRFETLRAAGAAASTALEIDPGLSEAKTVLAQLLLAERDVCGAIEAAEDARCSSPDDADANMWLGYIYAVAGHVDRALPFLEEAVNLDPLQGRKHLLFAIALLAEGQLDEGERVARIAIEQNFVGGHEPFAAAALLRGDTGQAVARFEAALEHFRAVYEREPRFAPLLGMAARGVYGKGELERRILLSALLPVSKLWRRSPDGLLPFLLLRTGSPSFYSSFGDRLLPGNSVVMLYLWDGSDMSKAVRRSAGLPAFAERTGLKAAWMRYGHPKALESR